jgi:phosphatidylglycerophosphatase A
MNIKQRFLMAYHSKPTVANNLLVIYGLPYSIICLAMAITHKATVEHILAGIMLYYLMGIMSYQFIELDTLKEDDNMIKFDWVLAFIMSAMATLGFIGLIWGANGI